MTPTGTFRAGLTSFFVLLLLALCPRLYAYDLTVAKDGTGNYTTVQAAIDAAPTGRITPYTIFIKNGKYREVVTVPSNKPFLQLVGESVGNTIITYNNSAGTLVAGVALGTQNSASVTINAPDFSALNITFENAFGEAASNGQAVAVLVNNDRAAFRNCRFLGNQDTLYVKGSGAPRQYFLNCYIEGNTDFIFGSAIALFESCNIYAKNKATASTSYIAVPNTPAGQAFGLVFKNCNVTGHSVAGGTSYDLGRPWQFNPKAAFLNCNLSTPLILDEGWSPTSSAGTATIGDSYFVEYQNTHFNGRAIKVSSRVLSGQNLTPAQPSSQLTAAEAALYTRATILSGWDPCALIDCVTPFVKPVIVNNFKGVKGATTSAFTWNTSWPIAGDVLSVYRATATPPAALGAFGVVNAQTEPSDTIFNYTYSDAVPASGSLYKYFVRGSATPRQISSDTVTISSAPTVVATGTLGNFTQQLGTPSSAQSVAVSGTDLTSGITVAASGSYQVSLTSGGTYTSSVVLTPSGGTVASTPVYVRLNAATAGPYTGTLTLSSPNATPVQLSLSGTAIVAPTISSVVLQQWPLRANSADSTFARNARLAATVPTLKRLYLSNGTTATNIPAYSNLFGQAFGASVAGDGQWGTAAGGPGGTLSRLYYEQFTLTVAPGSTARVDSLLFLSAFYNTSSNTKMAVVYSLNGFAAPADSLEISGGTGPGGALVLSGSGNFSKSFPLLNQTAATTAQYRVALSGPSTANPSGGVAVAGGQTLTVRLYYACGSTGIPRYAFLKNFRIKGDAQAVTVGDVTVTDGRTLTGTYNNVTLAPGSQTTLLLPLTVNTALTTAAATMLDTNGQPILGAGSVAVAAGSELRIGDADGISASGTSGAVRNTGARTFGPDARYTYNGTVAQASGNGLPATVRSLTVNNTARLAADRTLTLSAPVAVAQLLRLQAGNLLTSGNMLTLLSVAGQGTALIDNTGGVVTGTGTMQRAIDVTTPDNIGYHHYSAPVSNTTIGDLNATAFAPVLNPAYNIAALAGQVTPFPTVYGYNEARVTPGSGSSSPATDLPAFDKGFFSPNASTDPMSVGKGYTVNAPNTTLVDFVGTFNNGGYAINNLTRGTDAQAGWQLLGNPYPAPLDWSTVLASQLTNLDAAMYIYHSSGRYVGSYTTYLPNGLGTGGTGTGSPVIDAGAGFFVRVTNAGSTNGALTVSNANRVKTFGAQPAFGRGLAGTRPELQLQLAGAGLADVAFVYFDAQASHGLDAAYDATKLRNPNGLNLATVAGAEQLAVDGRPQPTAATVIPLFVGVPAAGTYSLRVQALDNFGATTATLVDALTGRRTALTAGSTYAFTMAAFTASGRFTLEFSPAGAPLATVAQVLAAQVQLFPNPASASFRVQLPVLAGNASVQATLLNTLGQVVRSRTLSAPAGQALSADFDVRGLAAGVYTLRLNVAGTSVVRKVVVE